MGQKLDLLMVLELLDIQMGAKKVLQTVDCNPRKVPMTEHLAPGQSNGSICEQRST